MYTFYFVVCWKYPGQDILSPLLENLEVAKRTADLERAKNPDYEHDIIVLTCTSKEVYVGKKGDPS
jgi:hypothetical protein